MSFVVHRPTIDGFEARGDGRRMLELLGSTRIPEDELDTRGPCSRSRKSGLSLPWLSSPGPSSSLGVPSFGLCSSSGAATRGRTELTLHRMHPSLLLLPSDT